MLAAAIFLVHLILLLMYSVEHKQYNKWNTITAIGDQIRFDNSIKLLTCAQV